MPEGSENVNIGEPIAIVVENKEDIAAFANATKDSIESDGAGDAPAAAPAASEPSAPVTTTPAPEPSAPAATPAVPAPAPAAPAATPAVPASAPAAPAATPAPDRVLISPLAKTILKNSGADINLSSIKGSGPEGRILGSDVLSAISAKPTTSAPAAPAMTAGASNGANFEDVAVTPMRRIISTRLTESKQSIPHYYVNQTCDMDQLLKVLAPGSSDS